ncbi:MAG: GFA family protein [Variibacter sp.]|nr:GFA family protein [Variibacter sp.]
MQTYTGGCQCGRVRYEVALALGEVISCNCSRCGRLGSLLAFSPAERFKLLSGEDALTDYQFNRHVIHHLFCATCGIQSFARGRGPDGVEMVAINVRCLDGVDVEALPVKTFDGRSL